MGDIMQMRAYHVTNNPNFTELNFNIIINDYDYKQCAYIANEGVSWERRFIEFSGNAGVDLGTRVVDQLLKENRRQFEIRLRWLNVDAQAFLHFVVGGAVEKTEAETVNRSVNGKKWKTLTKKKSQGSTIPHLNISAKVVLRCEQDSYKSQRKARMQRSAEEQSDGLLTCFTTEIRPSNACWN